MKEARAIESWDRRLKVMDGDLKLGQDVALDMLDLTVWNERLLPKFILLRQVKWNDGHIGSEFHIELMQLGNVMPLVNMIHITNEQSQGDSNSRYTLVELGWHEREASPWLADVSIFDGEGGYTTSHQRHKARIRAARAAKTDA